MSKGTLGSFNGTTTANVNMLDIFKQNEMAAHENSTLAFTDHMVIKKIGIQCEKEESDACYSQGSKGIYGEAVTRHSV